MYIYIYIKEKTNTGHIRIIHLFPSMGFYIYQKHQKQENLNVLG